MSRQLRFTLSFLLLLVVHLTFNFYWTQMFYALPTIVNNLVAFFTFVSFAILINMFSVQISKNSNSDHYVAFSAISVVILIILTISLLIWYHENPDTYKTFIHGFSFTLIRLSNMLLLTALFSYGYSIRDNYGDKKGNFKLTYTLYIIYFLLIYFLPTNIYIFSFLTTLFIYINDKLTCIHKSSNIGFVLTSIIMFIFMKYVDNIDYSTAGIFICVLTSFIALYYKKK